MCSYLSAVLLAGLVLNSLLGWWWADPIAALVIAAVAVREGRGAWQGDSCCTPVAVLLADPDGDTDGGCGCSGGCADACCAGPVETTASSGNSTRGDQS